MSSILFEASGKSFSVGKILCLGRNYAAHAQEMSAAVPELPVVFLKPATAIIHEGENVIIPHISADVHHEVEMVIVIGKRAKDVRVANAYAYVEGYAVGLDMTLRDVQAEAKQKGLPWTVAKGFDTSAPVSYAVEKAKVANPHSLTLSLKVNGERRQHSSTAKMIFRIDFLVSYLSTIFTLEPGDLIFTGTPEGVGSVRSGDVLEAELETVGTLRVGVIDKPIFTSS
jgi:2-keto-4-pentenoate hydratase/2-oxohepta-3-ene-1,7-dioic acid hydratase in catechol pathway